MSKLTATPTVTGGITRVAICIPTYQRPQSLTRLLDRLQRLEFTKQSVHYEIIVVDNDPSGGGEPVVRQNAEASPIPIRYVHEPRRGLATVRNRCLREAMDAFDCIVFIDDDQVPEADWLDHLVHTMYTFDSEIVRGAVRRKFDSPPPKWVAEGPFFHGYRFPTGTRMPVSTSANVLMRCDMLRSEGIWFDETFNLTGGEDSHFFRQLNDRGRKIVWSDEAIVYEVIPASRINRRWMLLRAYRNGTVQSISDLLIRPGMRTRAACIVSGLKTIAGAVLHLPVDVFKGRTGAIVCIRRLAKGLGVIAGAFGLSYREYRRVHGS